MFIDSISFSVIHGVRDQVMRLDIYLCNCYTYVCFILKHSLKKCVSSVVTYTLLY